MIPEPYSSGIIFHIISYSICERNGDAIMHRSMRGKEFQRHPGRFLRHVFDEHMAAAFYHVIHTSLRKRGPQPRISADIGIMRLPAQLIETGSKYFVSFSRIRSSAFTTAHPILLVPKSKPKIKPAL